MSGLCTNIGSKLIDVSCPLVTNNGLINLNASRYRSAVPPAIVSNVTVVFSSSNILDVGLNLPNLSYPVSHSIPINFTFLHSNILTYLQVFRWNKCKGSL
jgi:hypothetical protein